MFERRLYYPRRLGAARRAPGALPDRPGRRSTAPPASPTSHLRDADLRHRARARGAGRVPQHRLPVAGRQVALHLSAASCCCSSTCCSSAPCAAGRGAGSTSGAFNLQPSEFAKARWRWCWPSSSATARRGALTRADLLDRGGDHRRAAARHRPAARPRHRRHAGAGAASPWPSWPACRCGSFGILALVGVLVAPVAWKFALQDYQKERISTFLDPSQDARGAGYQQIQARITVGSGGLWGKGFTKGTQGQLRFLPVAHNDFIFSVLAEEQGFAGVLVALGLYLFVILRALEAARLAKDRLGRIPGAGSAGQLHVPGGLQHHDVGRPGAGQGTDASAHELRRLLHDCHAGGIRPDSQRADAAIYELSGSVRA